MNMNNEIWLPVKDYEGLYYVSSEGRLRSSHSNNKGVGWKIVKGATVDREYIKVKLIKDHIYKQVSLHRLVATTFIPNPKNKPQVNHKNGNKHDNRVENLEWVTQSENILHSYKTGLKKPMRGVKNWCAKITEADVLMIRKLAIEGQTPTQISKSYPINDATVSKIIHKQIWSHVN